MKENLTILNQSTYEFVICTVTNDVGAVRALFVFACTVNLSEISGCTKLSGRSSTAGSTRVTGTTRAWEEQLNKLATLPHVIQHIGFLRGISAAAS